MGGGTANKVKPIDSDDSDKSEKEDKRSFVEMKKMSGDEDNNSEADKFEAHISKVDESMVIQTNVNLQDTMNKIRHIYGPFDEAEIMFYIDQLTKEGRPIKNSFQFNLVSYLFLKDFKDWFRLRKRSELDDC